MPAEGYKMQRELWTPCCGADIHYLCRTVDLLPPIYSVPMTHNGRADHRPPGDILCAKQQDPCRVKWLEKQSSSQ